MEFYDVNKERKRFNLHRVSPVLIQSGIAKKGKEEEEEIEMKEEKEEDREEKDEDYFFQLTDEESQPKRKYEVMESFSGSSDEWFQKEDVAERKKQKKK